MHCSHLTAEFHYIGLQSLTKTDQTGPVAGYLPYSPFDTICSMFPWNACSGDRNRGRTTTFVTFRGHDLIVERAQVLNE